MADKETISDATWLPVIGRTLAYLCMKSAAADSAFKGVLDEIEFLRIWDCRPGTPPKWPAARRRRWMNFAT